VNKREKVVAVMQENPDWHLPRVASQVGCSESYVHLVRKQVKAAEYNAAKAELEAESTAAVTSGLVRVRRVRVLM